MQDDRTPDNSIGVTSEERIKYFEQKLHLVQVIGVEKDLVKFAPGPLAESHLCSRGP